MPNVLDPLIQFYRIPAFAQFYLYRIEHLFYYSPRTIGDLQRPKPASSGSDETRCRRSNKQYQLDFGGAASENHRIRWLRVVACRISISPMMRRRCPDGSGSGSR